MNAIQFNLGTNTQMITLTVWAVITVYLINSGGRSNGIFRVVVESGFKLILLGAVSAAVIGATGSEANKVFTDSAIQFILVLSAGVGGSYIAHANMALRDFPNKSHGPDLLPGMPPSTDKVQPTKRRGRKAER